MTTHELTSADDGRALSACVGDELVITLPENASTGYRWAVERVGEQLRGDRTASPGGAREPGAARLAAFRFEVVGAGESRLVLRHWRPWQGESSVLGRFALSVRAVHRQ
jgi:inhibitor of cysteine peptidase